MTLRKSRKLISCEVATAPNTVVKFGKYTFTYGRDLRPIPVEVDEDDAVLMLDMMDNPCNCHHVVPKHLFEEVV